MTILDTNVISALMCDPPETKVGDWLDRQVLRSIWTTSINILEIQTGLLLLPTGRKQAILTQVFERFLVGIDHRIAVFDEEAARLAGNLTAVRQKKGRSGEIRDTMIAGIVLAHRATLATRNVAHFADISSNIVNPWVL